jgi:prepilin peptidase CpaA
MDSTTKIWVIALALGLIAGWIDWRTRRIPNWLTVSGAVIGVAAHTYVSGWVGALVAIVGVVAAMIVLLPCVLLRAMGAGDWKLMAALGSIVGPLMVLFVLVAAIFLAGIMAAFMVIRARRVKETIFNIYVLIQGFFTFGLRANPEISLDNPALLKLPFGIAAAGGTLVCFLATRWSW